MMKKLCSTSFLLLLLIAHYVVSAQSTTNSANESKELRNKKIALAYFEAHQRGDIDASFKDFDKDVVVYNGGNLKPYKGVDSVIQMEKKNYPIYKSVFPDGKVEVTAAAAEGDYVFVATKETGTWKGDINNWKASGKSFEVSDATVFKFDEEGKITEGRSILPFTEIRKQVFDGVEADLNDAGYNLLNAKKYNDAIEVFKLNVKLYPESSNTYDSLGEAYAMAGNKKLAIENYEKSIKLNPKNEAGKKMLEKLKSK